MVSCLVSLLGAGGYVVLNTFKVLHPEATGVLLDAAGLYIEAS